MSSANAANELAQTFTLDGQLSQQGSANPLTDSHTQIVVEILDPSTTCLLYEEQQVVDTSSSNGYFSIQVGSGTTSGGKRTGSDPGRTMAQIFQNSAAISAANAPGKTCSGATYTPAAMDVRYFRLIVTPSSTGVADTLAPDIMMDSVPGAWVAQTLQGYTANQFLMVGTGDLTQANLQSIFSTGNTSKLNSLLSVPPANYITKDGTSGAVQLPSASGVPTGVQSGEIWYDSGTLKYYDGSAVKSLGASGYFNGGNAFGANASIGLTDNYSLSFITNNSTRMSINNSGSVGIGTSTPATFVHLNKSTSGGSTELRTENPAADGWAIMSAKNSTGAYINLEADGSTDSGSLGDGTTLQNTTSLLSFGGTAMLVGSLSAVPLKLFTNNTVRAVVDSSGKVGIGTATPQLSLDVNGNSVVRAVTTGSWNEGLSLVRNAASDFSWTSWHTGTAATSSPSGSDMDFGLGHNSGDNDLWLIASGMSTSTLGRIDASMRVSKASGDVYFGGNVGIGTTTPANLLDVSGGHIGLTHALKWTTSSISAYQNSSYPSIYASTGTGTYPFNGAGHLVLEPRLSGAVRDVVMMGSAATPTAVFTGGGKVGIGTNAPGYPLTVNGDVSIASANALRFGATSVCTSTGCTASSDQRLKENIEPLEGSLEKVLQLQGVSFDYKDKAQFTDKHQVGVIAQEVEKIYPEVVSTDKETGFKAVAYDHLIAPVIEAVKTLYSRIVGMDRDIASIKAQKADKQALDAVKAESDARIQKLEAENAALKAYICGKDPAAAICK